MLNVSYSSLLCKYCSKHGPLLCVFKHTDNFPNKLTLLLATGGLDSSTVAKCSTCTEKNQLGHNNHHGCPQLTPHPLCYNGPSSCLLLTGKWKDPLHTPRSVKNCESMGHSGQWSPHSQPWLSTHGNDDFGERTGGQSEGGPKGRRE